MLLKHKLSTSRRAFVASSLTGAMSAALPSTILANSAVSKFSLCAALSDWMFHCHILEHQAAGMTGVIRVA